MKIVSIETFVLEAPLGRPFGWSQGWITQRRTEIVRIATDTGLAGWAKDLHRWFWGTLAPVLLGEDPCRPARLWQRMFATLYNSNAYGSVGGSAMSAVDIALWDIAGKATGQPVHQLLGGSIRDRVAVYATGLYYTQGEFPLRLLDEARSYVEAGFLGMKTKVGGLSIEEDVRRVAAIREAIGADIPLMVDANQAYNAMTAIRIGRQLSDYNILWFEEPVSAKDTEAYLHVKAALPMALAGGEGLRTRYEFRDPISRHAFDIAQPDVAHVGGITELFHVGMLANTFGVQVNPHVWGSPIMIAATLHVTAALPPCPMARDPQPYAQEPVMEFDRTPNPIRETLCRVPFQQVDGYVQVPMGAGLGTEVDEAALASLCVHHDPRDLTDVV